MERTDTPFWSYFCQISDSTTSYGSYSGAVPNEKITWGKLDINTPKFIVYYVSCGKLLILTGCAEFHRKTLYEFISLLV